MKNIKISATTNSEWDSAVFFLIENSPSLKEQIILGKSIVDSIDDANFSSVSFYQIGDYVNMGDYEDEVEGVFKLTDTEVKDYTPTEQTIDTQRIIFTRYGFRFSGYGKHTSEEFWTDTIPYEDYFNLVK